MLSGKVRTVLGPIESNNIGLTLTHEHIRMDHRKRYCDPPREDHQQKALDNKITLENLGFIRQYPYSHHHNMAIGDEDVDTIIAEVAEFKRLGGDTLVDVTSIGLTPDYEFLKKVSQATNVNIICSTGYYLGRTLTDEVKNASIDDLVKFMMDDLTIGRNGIKAGCIGEIGCMYPLEECERRTLIAAGKVQKQVGCPLIIHPGRDEQAPFEIIDILKETGAEISKTVMSHLDRTLLLSDEILLKFAAYSSCFLEFDLFGIEASIYQFNLDIDFPTDAQRIKMIKLLVDHGYEDRIVIAHDISTRHRLIKYGGHGYGHILENVVPMMLRRGISQSVVDKILIHNPKRWLTY